MIHVTVEELQKIRDTVDHALAVHNRWVDNLHRVFACGLTPAENDIAEDAHKRCQFGQWFYSKANAQLRALPIFGEVGVRHAALHKTARDISIRLKAQGKVRTDDYDMLMGEIGRFRASLLDLQEKVAHTLEHVDALTGAFNSAMLLPDLKQEQQKLKQSGQPFSLLLVDIDVKEINQRHGRAAGDAVLRASVRSIRDALADQGRVYRYGGAEFVVCLPGLSQGDAETVKEQLLQTIGTASKEAGAASGIAFAVHYGIVNLDPDAYLVELIERCTRSTYTISL